jgi:2-dehydropantoate 2-reductase
MKIVVAGLGGVGGIIGGRLAGNLSRSSEHEVVFWCRGETLKAISEKGICILSDNGETIARPALATHDAGAVGTADLLIVATKGYHLDSAARELAPLTSKKTTVIPLLNGVSAPSVLERLLPESDVLGGCIYVSAYVEQPGIVHQVGTVQRILFGKKGVGEVENRARYGAIEQILKKNGVNAVLTDRIDVEMWSKFIFLSPFAGVTTLFKRSISEILENESDSATVNRMICEIEALGRAKNIDLPKNIADLTIEKAKAFAPLTKTSMQLDREKDKTTELDFLIGYVCREGNALKVPVPTYETIYEGLKKICKE